MKVCTDACLLGAFAVANSQVKIQNSKSELEGESDKLKALDIGTGTGLLSLMLAQKIDATIDAIEMDADASQQAIANIEASPWKDRIRVHHTTIQEFTNRLIDASPINHSTNQLFNHSTGKLSYDLIISNPPFFVNALKSDDHKKNNAKHNTSLPFTHLASAISSLLAEDGKAFIMLPPAEMKLLEIEMNKEQLFAQHFLLVKQTPSHDHFRAISLFAKRENGHPVIEEMTIRDKDQQNSVAFTALLKDYYLYL